MIDPLLKPELWNIQEAIVSYNAQRMGLPMPVGLWAMWEGSGATVYDLSGNGNDGALTTGVWQEGGIYFPEAGNIDTENTDLMVSDATIIIGFTRRVDASEEGIVSLADSGNGKWLSTRYRSSDHIWRYEIDDGVAERDKTGIKQVDDGNMYQFAFIKKSSDYNRLYIDDELVASDSNGSGDVSGANTWKLATNPTRSWNGTLFYSYFFKRALSLSQVIVLRADPYGLVRQPDALAILAAAQEVEVGAIMNQFQGPNLGADLFNGTLL